MLHPVTVRSFADELEKIAAMTGNQKLLLGTGVVGGGLAGAYIKDTLQDAKEGRTLRRGREFQQRQQLAAFNSDGDSHG
jgi:hypothetical protein